MAAPERVCEIYATGDRDDWKCGTGTLLPDGLVLTAAHVLAAGDPEVRVRLLTGGPLLHAEVVWRGNDDAVDAGLLRITDLASGAPAGLPALRWGRLVCDRAGAAVDAVGFPLVRVRNPDGAGTYRETEHITGVVQPLGLRKAGLIDIAVDSPPGRNPTTAGRHPTTREPWSGVSGAGLFCNDVLVGLIVRDEAGFDSRRLSAVPVPALFDDPEFRAALAPSDGAVPGLDAAELARLQDFPPIRTSPASLLRADAEVAPFRGREEIIARLDEWCDRPEIISAFLVVGQGGQGKTRLARHFAARRRAGRWATVVLGRARGDAAEWLESVDAHLLLVVDYAEHRLDEVEKLTAMLAGRRRDRKLRVLLLARSDGEWRKPSDAAWEFLAAAPAEQLTKLDPVVSRQSFDDAVAAFARRLAELPGFESIPWQTVAAGITTPAFRTPPAVLETQMAALTALLASATPALAAGDTVPQTLLRHEERYWNRIARQRGLPLSDATARAVLATVCLVPAADRAAACAVLARVPELEPAQGRAVAGWVRALYPDPTNWWGALQPDLLAEYLVGTVADDNPDLLATVLAGVGEGPAGNALTVLARAAVHQDRLAQQLTDMVVAGPAALARAAVTVATRTPEPRPLRTALDRIVAERGDDLALLLDLDRAIAPTSQLHAELAVRVAARMVELRRRRAPGSMAQTITGSAQANELAGALTRLALRLQQVSRHTEALAAIDESVTIRRRLSTFRGRQYRRDLAASLSILAHCLVEVGRRGEALEPISSAVDIRRGLAGNDADDADLARALNNLSNCLAELDHHEEALAPIQETVAIRRRLPGAEAELARALNNLSVALGYLGRSVEALDAIDRAVAVFRRLAQERPDEFQPELAGALDNQAIRLIQVGRPHEALDAGTEATVIYRRLIARSNACLPGLASALTNRSDCASAVGLDNEALMDIQGAVTLYRGLENERPTVFRAPLRKALNKLSDRLLEVGRTDEADGVDAEIDVLERNA
jgi:tetratricopeptide (TPR) repeat protein